MRTHRAHLDAALTRHEHADGDAMVFLDKDGTLIENVPYNVDPSRMRLAPGAKQALPPLADAGFRFAVISNQPGVALGRFPEHALADVDARLREMLAEIGVSLSGFFYCPHHPDGVVAEYALACECRKPEPGLVLRAAWELGADLRRSWLVGDILDDIEAGNRAGCGTVLLDTGNETEWVFGRARYPGHIARTLPEAASIILTASRPALTCARAALEAR
ncbi:MAG TPA: HAD family hydrolase [Gemmatimonadaceae bacterium]|jgi:histidinol-phosphate phosphatase family protein|nr:HAD family hydrolase [Gemmatimonadaceae bacterium]